LGRARGKGRGEATLTTTTTTTTVALTTTTTVTFSTTLRSQHISETRTGLEKEIQRVKVKGRTGLKKGISKDLLTEPRKGPAKGSMENQQCLQVKAKGGKKERAGEACQVREHLGAQTAATTTTTTTTTACPPMAGLASEEAMFLLTPRLIGRMFGILVIQTSGIS